EKSIPPPSRNNSLRWLSKPFLKRAEQMIVDATLGPSAPEHGWVPAPRYLLRRAQILRELRTLQPCETLEIGPGAGMLLHELDARGFRCQALEMSEAARAVADTLAHEAGRELGWAFWAGDGIRGARTHRARSRCTAYMAILAASRRDIAALGAVPYAQMEPVGRVGGPFPAL